MKTFRIVVTHTNGTIIAFQCRASSYWRAEVQFAVKHGYFPHIGKQEVFA